LLKVTRDEYFSFITREDELYGEPNVAMLGLDGLLDCSFPKLSSSLVDSVEILPHFTRDAGNLAQEIAQSCSECASCRRTALSSSDNKRMMTQLAHF
jgi:hypothetical protein